MTTPRPPRRGEASSLKSREKAAEWLRARVPTDREALALAAVDVARDMLETTEQARSSSGALADIIRRTRALEQRHPHVLAEAPRFATNALLLVKIEWSRRLLPDATEQAGADLYEFLVQLTLYLLGFGEKKHPAVVTTIILDHLLGADRLTHGEMAALFVSAGLDPVTPKRAERIDLVKKRRQESAVADWKRHAGGLQEVLTNISLVAAAQTAPRK